MSYSLANLGDLSSNLLPSKLMFDIPYVTEWTQEHFWLSLASSTVFTFCAFWCFYHLDEKYWWSIKWSAWYLTPMVASISGLGFWLIILADKTIEVKKDQFFIMMNSEQYWDEALMLYKTGSDALQKVKPDFKAVEPGAHEITSFSKAKKTYYTKVSVSFDPGLPKLQI